MNLYVGGKHGKLLVLQAVLVGSIVVKMLI